MVRKNLLWSAASIALVASLMAAGAVHAAAGDPPKERPVAVDINTATAADLEKLPGVGPALAKRIVEFREANGPFGSVDDLLKVQGIGEKSLARFRDLVTASKSSKK